MSGRVLPCLSLLNRLSSGRLIGLSRTTTTGFAATERRNAKQRRIVGIDSILKKSTSDNGGDDVFDVATYKVNSLKVL